MRISTRIVLDWDGNVLERESFEYSGPVALCDRKTSGAIAQQGIANSKTDQGNAASSLSATNAALKNYSGALNNFMNFGRSTYGANGEFAQDENTIANTTAAAGNKTLQGNLALNAMRTGANTASYAPTVASSLRQGEQDLTNQLATADATRLQNLTNINAQGVQMSALPAQIQSSLYGTSVNAANSALSGAAGASAADQSFSDQLGASTAANLGKFAGPTPAAAGCWIAAAIFDGWDDPRTHLVREWLHQEFARSRMGRAIVDAYMRYGERVADWLKRNPRMKRPFRWLFNRALGKARIWAAR